MNNGIKAEFIISKAFQKCGIKPIKSSRFTYVSSKKYNLRSLQKYTDIIKASGLMRDINHFSMEPCRHGSRKGGASSTADIVLFNGSYPRHRISIKHNNNSIKHQRPEFLCDQMGFKDKKVIKNFSSLYKKINARWFKRWENHEFFSNVPETEKRKWYSQINTLTLNTLNLCIKKYPKKFKTYLEFLIDTKTRHIFKLNFKNDDLIILKKNVSLSELMKNIKLRKRGNFIEFLSNGMLFIKMRLHSSTSRITNNLGIKYDTSMI